MDEIHISPFAPEYYFLHFNQREQRYNIKTYVIE